MKKLIPLLMGRYLNTMARLSPATTGSQGFRLFCYPFRPPLRPHQKQFLSGGADYRLTVEDSEVQVYRWGYGPKKVLMLHGWQSHSYRWKNYVEALPWNEYTVYSVDAPGHGLSKGSMLTVPLYSKAIEAFVQKTGSIDTIVSHSLGAFTALYTLSRLPLLPVTKLVLLAPPGEATEFINFYRQTLQLSDHSVSYILDHFEKVIGYPVDYFSASKFASTLRQPGLIIHDTSDDETPHAHSIAIHKAWPKSELVLTEKLGHNLKSAEIIKQVVGFVRKDEFRISNFKIEPNLK